jgi:peptide/nickel transport system permease protein
MALLIRGSGTSNERNQSMTVEKKWYEPIVIFIKSNRLATIGGILVFIFLLMGIFAPVIAPFDPNKINLRGSLMPPGSSNLLGTDHQGRDLLSRIIFGARISLGISFASVLFGSAIGTILGIIAGWFSSLETIIMRTMDVLLSFPSIVTALTILAILGPGINNLIFAIAVYQIPQFARLTHGQTLTVKNNTYVIAALSLGIPNYRIILRHILPNIMASIIVQISLLIPSAVMMTAGLSFLGLGISPPTAEWGGMLQDSLKHFYRAPHLMIFPGLALMLVVFGFNTFGDGLRISLDPRMRGRF